MRCYQHRYCFVQQEPSCHALLVPRAMQCSNQVIEHTTGCPRHAGRGGDYEGSARWARQRHGGPSAPPVDARMVCMLVPWYLFPESVRMRWEPKRGCAARSADHSGELRHDQQTYIARGQSCGHLATAARGSSPQLAKNPGQRNPNEPSAASDPNEPSDRQPSDHGDPKELGLAHVRTNPRPRVSKRTRPAHVRACEPAWARQAKRTQPSGGQTDQSGARPNEPTTPVSKQTHQSGPRTMAIRLSPAWRASKRTPPLAPSKRTWARADPNEPGVGCPRFMAMPGGSGPG
jgi:hypothetical protein